MSESETAMRKGWHPIGVKKANVKKVLTDTEKQEMGEKTSEALTMVETLSIEKAKFNKRIDTQIKALNSEALAISKDIKNGYIFENQELPCYIDKKARERVFINEFDREVHREPMQLGDEQMALGGVA